jgi:hypothetical protein
MSRPSKAAVLAQVHDDAIEQFDAIQMAQREERKQCLEDRRFYSIAGAQWEGDLAEQFANKPKFEVNKIHMAVMRIINEYRNNRIDVQFVAKDGEEDALSDVCAGLYRADEKDSGAEEAYDNAFEEAVGGGFGAFRLRTEYEDEEDEDNDHQRIRIEPVFDADSSVFFDLSAKRQDKADAKHAFVLFSLTPEAFRDEWGFEPISVQKIVKDTRFDWVTPDVVFIAEYYRVEETRELVRWWKDLIGNETRYTQEDFDASVELDEDGQPSGPSLEEQLLAVGSVEVRAKKVIRKRVHKYIIDGERVLEDCGYIAGRHIPVVPVYGKRWFVDNVERCMGHVRLAKDAQRLKNMQLSKLGEISALSSVEKPIVMPEQMAGHTAMWAEDNLKDYPYLLLNPITDRDGNPVPAGPIAYTHSANIPPAMAALLQITESDMQDILGNRQNAEKMVSNISGKAVDLIQSSLDMQTYIYVSNFAKAVRRAGEVWLGMAREVYVEKGRLMKSVGTQANVSTVELMRPVINEGTGERGNENDLTAATFDVAVEVGPSSKSRKESTVNTFKSMLAMTQDPDDAMVLRAMVFQNMEGEGISDVREYYRKKMVQKGVIKPTEEEAKAMAQAAQTPDPQAEYLKAAADQAQAEATKARASVVKTVAETEKIHAETVKTLAEVDMETQGHALEMAQSAGLGAPTPAPTIPQAVYQPAPVGGA